MKLIKMKQLNGKLLMIILMIIIMIISIMIFIPKPIIDSVEELTINSVIYKNEDVTTKVNEELVINIIKKYRYSISLKKMRKYQVNKFSIEIDANRLGKPIHILLGEDYVCYESIGECVYKIIDGNELYEELLKVVK